jgi:hypothetical protein
VKILLRVVEKVFVFIFKRNIAMPPLLFFKQDLHIKSFFMSHIWTNCLPHLKVTRAECAPDCSQEREFVLDILSVHSVSVSTNTHTNDKSFSTPFFVSRTSGKFNFYTHITFLLFDDDKLCTFFSLPHLIHLPSHVYLHLST